MIALLSDISSRRSSPCTAGIPETMGRFTWSRLRGDYLRFFETIAGEKS